MGSKEKSYENRVVKYIKRGGGQKKNDGWLYVRYPVGNVDFEPQGSIVLYNYIYCTGTIVGPWSIIQEG